MYVSVVSAVIPVPKDATTPTRTIATHSDGAKPPAPYPIAPSASPPNRTRRGGNDSRRRPAMGWATPSATNPSDEMRETDARVALNSVSQGSMNSPREPRVP
jgi:hypothetical protein